MISEKVLKRNLGRKILVYRDYPSGRGPVVEVRVGQVAENGNVHFEYRMGVKSWVDPQDYVLVNELVEAQTVTDL